MSFVKLRSYRNIRDTEHVVELHRKLENTRNIIKQQSFSIGNPSALSLSISRRTHGRKINAIKKYNPVSPCSPYVLSTFNYL